LRRPSIDETQRTRAATQDVTQSANDVLGRAIHDGRLRDAVDEVLIGELPAREAGDVLEEDGRAGLGC
jgi:hypothetical protein